MEEDSVRTLHGLPHFICTTTTWRRYGCGPYLGKPRLPKADELAQGHTGFRCWQLSFTEPMLVTPLYTSAWWALSKCRYYN